MKLKEFIKLINTFAPEDWQEGWDKSRLQIGDPAAEISRVVLALDPDGPALEACQAFEADLLLTHHPLFFRPAEGLRSYVPEERIMRELLRGGISVYSAHTSLDAAPWGVNYALAERLDLADFLEPCPLVPCAGEYTPVSVYPACGNYRQTVPGMAALAAFGGSRLALLERIKQAFGPAVRLNFSEEAAISRLVLSGGAWDESWTERARAAGVDAIVTGEMKYHEQIACRERGLAVYEIGHGASEKPVLSALAAFLRDATELEISVFFGQESRSLTEKS